ncbi:hypothetical protein ACHAXS_014184 [Conticribra weissflogii]
MAPPTPNEPRGKANTNGSVSSGRNSSGTVVSMPPVKSNATYAGTTVSLPPPAPVTSAGRSSVVTGVVDPETLLDSLDSFSAKSRYSVPPPIETNAAGEGNDGSTEDNYASQQRDFDPIEFLNQHYHTESHLLSALPTLRSAIQSRLVHLDDSLSTTLRHQAALSPLIAQDVLHARSAVIQLAQRIENVREQAQKSEVAVLEITRDMKRLDYAKRHLQRTITALKRLHMLLHAAEQLRMAALVTPQQPVPNYRVAAHLIDATRLLLGHFEGYMASVPKMRQVRDAVGVLRVQLREGIVRLFKELGFQDNEAALGKKNDLENDDEATEGDKQNASSPSPPSAMVRALSDACLVIEALGPKSKEQFIADFISDHLEEYEQLYNPSPAAIVAGKKGSSTSSTGGKSFKRDSPDGNAMTNPASIDQVESRYMWYRSKLRTLQTTFYNVFPPHWNVHYRLTANFLERSARHLKFVLKKHGNTIRIASFTSTTSTSGSTSGMGVSVTSAIAASKFGASLSVSTHGPSSTSSTKIDGGSGDNSVTEGEKAVTALLKALQKTILFEKEMSAWLSRDFGVVFLDTSEVPGNGDSNGGYNNGGGKGADDELEFDEQGRAVAASSAEGIRIKYERRKKQQTGGVVIGTGSEERAEKPVPPLLGIASHTFDDHMSPYVALEERAMDEQLHTAQSDNTVDTRGERPVFVSSTNLFIYMKNSITRCTALTKEKTFYLLQRAFQKKLQSYASVLDKKIPQPVSQNVAKLALANIQSASSSSGGLGQSASQSSTTIYRIPQGEEVTICHVIDTCEYCADTVEALEDLIRDKIGSKYKEKIDMSGEQEAFHDVTAKCIRVLVSGLEQRLDAPLKEVSRTNWSSFEVVGEESSYVRAIHSTIHPFVVQVRELIPSSYFRSFCDKFAIAFASTYYHVLLGLKKISESGTQQLLLDVYSVKTLLLKLPVLEGDKKTVTSRHSNSNPATSLSVASTIPPAMYTKMVNKEFRKLEVMLKLVGSPKELLIEMFRVQWDNSINTNTMASDFQMIMNLKGIPRNEQSSMLESLGLDGGDGPGVDGSSSMTANIQALQERGSDVAAKVNADLNQMRQRVDDFRRAFR